MRPGRVNAHADPEPDGEYPVAITDNAAGAPFVFKNVGSAGGSIIATIMASHMSWKLMEEANQDCPGMGIHIDDNVQPPGIAVRNTSSDKNKLSPPRWR